jgi:hypothetical protein
LNPAKRKNIAHISGFTKRQHALRTSTAPEPVRVTIAAQTARNFVIDLMPALRFVPAMAERVERRACRTSPHPAPSQHATEPLILSLNRPDLSQRAGAADQPCRNCNEAAVSDAVGRDPGNLG